MRKALLKFVAIAAGSIAISTHVFAQGEGAAVEPAPDPTAPVITFDATSLDLGEVPKGDQAKFVYTFRNTGASELVIENAKPSCGCTIAEFTKTVQPGATGTVNATIDTKRFRGPITKTITISSNDPVSSKVHLQAKANVKPFLDMLPSQHVFLRADRGQGATKTVTLVSYEEDHRLEIEKVESTDPLLSVTHRRITEGMQDEEGNPIEGDFELTVHLDEKAPVGRISGTVDVFTNNPKVEKMTMQVRGNVRGLVQVRPSRVFLGNLPESVEEPIKKTVRVTHRQGGALEIKKVESSFDGFKTSVREIEKGGYEVELTVEGDLPLGTLDEQLTIHTNDADEPEIAVRIRGQVG